MLEFWKIKFNNKQPNRCMHENKQGKEEILKSQFSINPPNKEKKIVQYIIMDMSYFLWNH